MEFLLTTQTEQTPGPKLKLRCPQCGKGSKSAKSYEQRDRLSLFYVIPLFGMTNAFVKCPACSAKFTSRLSIEELEQHAASDVSQYLTRDVSLVVRFLAVASILLFFVPFVGLILALLAVVLSRKTGGWTAKLGKIALVLSVLMSVVFVIILVAGG